MSWRDDYKRKFVSPDEAVKVVRSGEIVAIPIDTEAWAVSKALMARQSELKNVAVLIRRPRRDLGWFEGDFGDAFKVVMDTQPSASAALNEKCKGTIPALSSVRFRDDAHRTAGNIDVAIVVVSPPDDDGYCSFGMYLSHKGDYARSAKKVLAEVSTEPQMMVRLPGDGQIHVSQITHFTEHVTQPAPAREASDAPPNDAEKKISEYVASLVRDGDTIQVGPGSVTESVISLGLLDSRRDLGIHSAIIKQAKLGLVKKGVVTGKRKNVNPGLSVTGGFSGISAEGIAFISHNKHFLMKDMSYVNDIRVIGSHDNMVCINGVLAIDLAGQLATETLGTRLLGGAGGQVEFVIGAALSKGGRSITALRSTAGGGKISRILPSFEPGTLVNIPRTFADYVVTEYGIASLWGKTERERALELISVAHPDFRPDLKKAADKLYRA
ncbi:MAG: acetyl-CoA hydrolase/transferase C-terminal domain-containing protein [Dehalococcoidales bacterium]|nr:acetyl-CoA hydrolase/transferase C-terminal domain-containing protein [Dehalococcoidales bacterium]